MAGKKEPNWHRKPVKSVGVFSHFSSQEILFVTNLFSAKESFSAELIFQNDLFTTAIYNNIFYFFLKHLSGPES